jgi:hypothetical protein
MIENDSYTRFGRQAAMSQIEREFAGMSFDYRLFLARMDNLHRLIEQYNAHALPGESKFSLDVRVDDVAAVLTRHATEAI